MSAVRKWHTTNPHFPPFIGDATRVKCPEWHFAWEALRKQVVRADHGRRRPFFRKKPRSDQKNDCVPTIPENDGQIGNWDLSKNPRSSERDVRKRRLRSNHHLAVKAVAMPFLVVDTPKNRVAVPTPSVG